jgi:hypothetical protein
MTDPNLPTDEECKQFAVMVHAGLPPTEAILYFRQTDDSKLLATLTRLWQRSRGVGRALAQLMGKSWQAMTLEERCKYALDQHYSQLAYLLYSQHYAEVAQGDKSKLDTARTAIEAKLAGTAGKGAPLDQFFEDLRSGRLKLAPKALTMPGLES